MSEKTDPATMLPIQKLLKPTGTLLKSVFRYPGAKSRFLGEIVDARMHHSLQNAKNYLEAFVGGGSVVLYVAKNYPNIERIYVNDFDKVIASFWKCMASKELSQELAAKVLSANVTIDLHKELQGKLPGIDRESELESAYIGLCLNRMSFSGILESGPIGGKTQEQQKDTPWKVDCRFNQEFIAKQIIIIHNEIGAKLHVDNESFSSFIPKHSSLENAVLYCDPPYYVKGDQLYRCGMSDKDGVKHHKLHQELADTLKQCPIKWYLSYDYAVQVKNMYYGWCNIDDFNTRYSVRGYKQKQNIQNQKGNWTANKEYLISSKDKTNEESRISLQGHPIAAEVLGTQFENGSEHGNAVGALQV